jgi:hypothetical protein
MATARKNMIAGKIAFNCGETFRGQILLGGEMRKLNNPGPIDSDNGNQTGTR